MVQCCPLIFDPDHNADFLEITQIWASDILNRPELLSKYQTILSFTHSLSASLIPPPPPPTPKADELQRERDNREYERAWKRTTANVVIHPSKPAEMEQAGRLLNMLVTKQVR
jgi:hypothetical protein